MKQLFTSYLAKKATDPKSVAICAWVPHWFRVPKRYPDLAPTMEMVKKYKAGEIDNTEYTETYFEIVLDKRGLKAQQIVDDMDDGTIMLCFEKPGEFCHRRLVAKWVESETGLVVPEWTAPTTPKPPSLLEF